MPQRVLVSSSDSGPANLTFPTNPRIYLPNDSPFIASFETTGGTTIWQQKTFDGRIRTMTWQGNEVGSVHISALDTYMRSVEGEIRYFNFQDMDDINTRWPSATTWKKARIISVIAKYRPGGALKYDTFSLLVQPEL